MYLLGFDIGSSSVKACLIKASDGSVAASAAQPKTEMVIHAPKPGWAEQDPNLWWDNLKSCMAELRSQFKFSKQDVKAIGISYQMHGLVCVNKNLEILRPAIIWCDSRAVSIGEKAYKNLGEKKILPSLLNSPGNFTASKLRWVQENEPKIYEQLYKILLPGDYIAMRMTGVAQTTVSGLSEGIFWDFEEQSVAKKILKEYKIDPSLIPSTTETFCIQGYLIKQAADELGLAAETPIAYRAGDQPNNAFALNVLNNGEFAATAGTSGVIYGVSNKALYDKKSRVNTFVHVNHTPKKPSYGILLCINGTGIQNSWLKNTLLQNSLSYDQMNKLAAKVEPGSDGLQIYPFGNGSERVLENRELGASVRGLQFNRHTHVHILRAAQEGIAFGMFYGICIMKDMGLDVSVVRAGETNMFLSPVFREVFCNTTGAVLELYNTDGAQGAARGAGIGAGLYDSPKEAFKSLKKVKVMEPEKQLKRIYKDLYYSWAEGLKSL